MSNDSRADVTRPEDANPDVPTPGGGDFYEGDHPQTSVVVDRIRLINKHLDAAGCDVSLDTGVPWICCRDRGHPGRHIANGIVTVCAAWPGSHLPTLDDLAQVTA